MEAKPIPETREKQKSMPFSVGHLAVEGMVSASTQSQALNALVFLYKHVLDLPVEGTIGRWGQEARQASCGHEPGRGSLGLHGMKGVHLQMAKLLYGGGLRLVECFRMRVKDLDFDRGLGALQRSRKAYAMRSSMF